MNFFSSSSSSCYYYSIIVVVIIVIIIMIFIVVIVIIMVSLKFPATKQRTHKNSFVLFLYSSSKSVCIAEELLALRVSRDTKYISSPKVI